MFASLNVSKAARWHLPNRSLSVPNTWRPQQGPAPKQTLKLIRKYLTGFRHELHCQDLPTSIYASQTISVRSAARKGLYRPRHRKKRCTRAVTGSLDSLHMGRHGIVRFPLRSRSETAGAKQPASGHLITPNKGSQNAFNRETPVS